MSDLDRELLLRVGLTPAKAAELMDRTRQAISKGVASDKHYFSPGNLRELTDAVEAHMPEKKSALESAIADMFDALTDRFGGGGPDRSVVAAIEEAERLWLIFPRFAASVDEQPEAYGAVFDAIATRVPATRLREPKRPKLEVTVYCDRNRNRVALERRFEEPWFRQRRLLIIECDLLENMSPMIVSDPHRAEQNVCFDLTRKGFVSMAPGEAAARVANFGAHVSEKINSFLNDPTRQPVDAQHDDLATLAKTGVRKI